MEKIFYDFESTVNIFRPKKDLWSGELPIYQLELSKEDIKQFNELSEKAIQQGYSDPKTNVWRKAKLKYEDRNYDVEIKLHGDALAHWGFPIKSYKINLLNDEYESINDLTKFNFIILEERLLDGKIVKILSSEFGLFDIRDDFVVLKINDVPQGLYYLVERLDTDFFEHNQCSSCELIKTRSNRYKDHPEWKEESDNPNLDNFKPYGIDYVEGHVTPFDYELSYVDLEKSDLDKNKVLNSVNELFQAVKDGDTQKVISYFDIDEIATFEAQRMLSGFGQVAGDDLKLVYKATNSKFYPIPFEGGLQFIKVEEGGFERSLNLYALSNELEVKLFGLLNRNDQIRQLKYKKIYQYIINNGDLFLDKIDDLVNKYLPYANAHKGSTIGTKTIETRFKEYKPLFKHNIDVIKDVLEYATCYINVVEKKNKIRLEIIPDSISQLKFDSLRINLLPNTKYSGIILSEFKDEDNNLIITKPISVEETNSIDLTEIIKDFYFMTGLDEELGTKKRIYTIELTFSNTDRIFIDNIQPKIRNDITNELLDDTEVYLQIANANDYYGDLIRASPNEFINMYEEFNWVYNDNTLTLLKGDYTLKRDLIIPKGLTWNIEPGVQILIDLGKSIVSYSPINILGTEAEPVVVKALDHEKPFGVFGIVGEKGHKTTINWLELSGGNEKFINGMFLSGQLSLYHTDVEIKNSVLSGSHSDDGINIKYGKILVDNCLFTNNFGDQFDGDYVEGVVKNSRFIEEDPNADSNGDGLDFSGSKVIVKNNLFKGFKDKGLSIGEYTKPIIVYNNIFDGNNLGSAIKDASHAFFIKNSFKGNDIALSAYQKKTIYPGGGYFYLLDNEFQSNVKDYEMDDKSYKEGLKLDESTYNKIEGYITDEDSDSLFQALDPYIKNDRK